MDQNKPVEPVGGVKDTTIDNPPPINPPEYKYEEINKGNMRDVVTPPAPQEPKAPETPAEEEIPLEEVGKKIAEDAANAVLEKQKAEAQAAEEAKKAAEIKKEPTEDEKVYIEWEKKFNETNSRPPTYLEAMQFVKEQAVAEIENKQQAKEAELAKQQEEAKKAQEEESKRINTFVDDELQDAYNAGKLTKIQDPNSPSDQGVIERKALFTKWAEVNNERRAKGLPDIISATRIIDYYWKKPNAQPAGVDAPVMGSRSATTPPGEQEPYKYQDLKKPWSFFKRS